MQTNESLIEQTQRAMSADETTEREIVAKGLTAPRVTLADLQENVVDVEIHKHVTKSGQVLRWAILTTRCGFAVVGNPSCSVSSENDNEELGVKVAIDNSRSALWPLMGYELRQRLHGQARFPGLTGAVLTAADAAADLAGTPRPDHPSAAPAATTFQERMRVAMTSYRKTLYEGIAALEQQIAAG